MKYNKRAIKALGSLSSEQMLRINNIIKTKGITDNYLINCRANLKNPFIMHFLLMRADNKLIIKECFYLLENEDVKEVTLNFLSDFVFIKHKENFEAIIKFAVYLNDNEEGINDMVGKIIGELLKNQEEGVI